MEDFGVLPKLMTIFNIFLAKDFGDIVNQEIVPNLELHQPPPLLPLISMNLANPTEETISLEKKKTLVAFSSGRVTSLGVKSPKEVNYLI